MLIDKTSHKKLCKCDIKLGKSLSEKRWYPYDISIYVEFLNNYIDDLHKDLRKNIAYNMQYLEYLHQTYEELSLSSVITTQNHKSFIIFSVSIIECILYYWLVSSGYEITKEWNQFHSQTIPKGKMRATIIFESKPEMNLEAMIETAKKKNLFETDNTLYDDLHELRQLRNKTHMYNPKDQETDWHVFNRKQLALAKSALFKIFIILFKPNPNQEKIINFLKTELIYQK